MLLRNDGLTTPNQVLKTAIPASATDSCHYGATIRLQAYFAKAIANAPPKYCTCLKMTSAAPNKVLMTLTPAGATDSCHL